MRSMGIAIVAGLALVGMFALAPPHLAAAQVEMESPALAMVDTDTITMDGILVVKFDLLGIGADPVLVEAGRPAEPVPLPPRQIGQLPPGITPAPADRYLC